MTRKELVVAAGRSQTDCVALDGISDDRCSIVVTAAGQPAARVLPVLGEERGKRSLIGSLVEDSGLLDPVDVAWDADA